MSREVGNERHQVVPVQNAGSAPVTVVLEPEGAPFVVGPGKHLVIAARGPVSGELEIERGARTLTVYGWGGSKVRVMEGTKTELMARLEQLDYALSTAAAANVTAPMAVVDEQHTLRLTLAAWDDADAIVMS